MSPTACPALTRGVNPPSGAWGIVLNNVNIVGTHTTYNGSILYLNLKIQITVMKKRGKLPYSASSTLELYDDFFVEITETERREVKYTGAEGIMVAEDGSVYIYMNSLMAYILPVGTFESDEVRDEIREFLLDKVAPLK